MKLQLVTPYLSGFWMLKDMLESFGESDIPILIVDNSPESDCAKDNYGFQFPSNVTVEYFPQNIGATAAWNIALRLGADQTILCSQMVRFAPLEIARKVDEKGELTDTWGLNYVARAIEKYANEWGMHFGDQGYHLISIGRKTIDTIGYPDEQLYFYGNDDEYEHRIHLADIQFGGWPKSTWAESGIYSIGYGVQKWEGKGQRDGVGRIKDYVSFKWGENREYTHPFNNPDADIGYWPEVET